MMCVLLESYHLSKTAPPRMLWGCSWQYRLQISVCVSQLVSIDTIIVRAHHEGKKLRPQPLYGRSSFCVRNSYRTLRLADLLVVAVRRFMNKDSPHTYRKRSAQHTANVRRTALDQDTCSARRASALCTMTFPIPLSWAYVHATCYAGLGR